MLKQTPPFTVVLLSPIVEHPIYALISPSGDSILLSQDTKVSNLVNIPELIAEELGTYDKFLINNRKEFKLLSEVVLDFAEEKIFPKVQSDLLEDSLFIIRAICSYKTLIEDSTNTNSMRANPKVVEESKVMEKAIEHSILLEQLMLDLSSNIERLQNSQN